MQDFSKLPSKTVTEVLMLEVNNKSVLLYSCVDSLCQQNYIFAHVYETCVLNDYEKLCIVTIE